MRLLVAVEQESFWLKLAFVSGVGLVLGCSHCLSAFRAVDMLD